MVLWWRASRRAFGVMCEVLGLVRLVMLMRLLSADAVHVCLMVVTLKVMRMRTRACFLVVMRRPMRCKRTVLVISWHNSGVTSRC